MDHDGVARFIRSGGQLKRGANALGRLLFSSRTLLPNWDN